jgi:hypothetical protein
VVLVAVAGLFGERLVEMGVEDGAQIPPLAFALVAATVVLHGFTLTPLARALGLVASDSPGVLIVGGSRWSVALARTLEKLELPVMIADANRARLRRAREAGLRTFYGDILSETADHSVDFMPYEKVVTATDNAAYNTLVATDLAPEFGRENVYQLARDAQETARHALPPKLGGRKIGGGETFRDLDQLLIDGWEFRTTTLTDEFGFDDWKATHPEGILVAELTSGGALRLVGDGEEARPSEGTTLIALTPQRATREPSQD